MDLRHLNHPFRLIGLTLFSLLVGCTANPNGAGNSGTAANSGVHVQGVNLNDVSAPAPHEGPVTLAAAKNEWTNFAVQINGLQGAWGKRPLMLRVQPLKMGPSDARIGSDSFTAFQVLNMPVDGSRAGYVRHTGLPASTRSLP